MFIYLSIDASDNGQPEFRLSADHRPIAQFPATVDGLRNLGRLIVSQYLGQDVFFSSDLDFPQECGVSLSSDEVHAAIHEGLLLGPQKSELTFG